MTIQQEAYRLIDSLSDSNVKIVIDFIRDLPRENVSDSLVSASPDILERKAAAFAKLQELRKEFAATQPGSFEEERAAAMSEKYSFLVP